MSPGESSRKIRSYDNFQLPLYSVSDFDTKRERNPARSSEIKANRDPLPAPILSGERTISISSSRSEKTWIYQIEKPKKAFLHSGQTQNPCILIDLLLSRREHDFHILEK
jgi:hypothetical protein